MGLALETQQYIDGKWVEGTSTTVLEVENPATEEILASFPDASVADVEAAILAARRAFDEGPWPHTTPKERAAKLSRLAELVAARKDEIVEILIAEVGCPRTLANGLQYAVPQIHLEDMADRVLRTFEFERPMEPVYGMGIGQGVIRYEPAGVVAAITPFNYPHYINVSKLGPALAGGNTVVLKPSPLTPLSALWLARQCEEVGFPPGVVNFVTGDLEASKLLTSHPAVDVVTFTGSDVTGRHIMQQASADLKRVVLELGGKSANIWLDDATIDKALPASLGFVRNTGQGCAAQTRILVHERLYDEAVDRLVAAMQALQVGDPQDAATDVGPLISAAQRERVERYTGIGKDEGATLAFGGGRPSGLDKGHYVEPTLFVDVKTSMTVAQDEIFGPVGVVIPFRDDDEAVAIANDSRFGLSGAVWSANTRHAYDVASRLRTGGVYVNGAGGGINPYGPFGGYKHSGIGREFGVFGLQEYLEAKTIVWTVAGG
ncbi:MAG TPA: aldehyde dehydrogenase family protein [Desertimonas sp.]|nr:aldehyde dehydrogenase family protein [Desertimonas sp.]